MKRLNLYYIVSIVTLASMMFILFRTLQVTGWFDEPPAESTLELVSRTYPGTYQAVQSPETLSQAMFYIESVDTVRDENWFSIRQDSVAMFHLKLSDFEEEQILVEIYKYDSSGTTLRLDGCELLIHEDEAGHFKGGTIGDFCGLMDPSSEYLAVDVLLSAPTVLLEIETRELGRADSLGLNKYLFERVIDGRE